MPPTGGVYYLMRKYWGKTGLPLPEIDLLSVQKESYDWFLTDGIRMALAEISFEKRTPEVALR